MLCVDDTRANPDHLLCRTINTDCRVLVVCNYAILNHVTTRRFPPRAMIVKPRKFCQRALQGEGKAHEYDCQAKIRQRHEQVREVTDTGTAQSKEMFETIGAATTEAADVMKNCCSTALRGCRIITASSPCSQANIKSYVEFVQKLAGVKSPSEFLEVSTAHTRHQLETAGEQAKQLADIAQKIG